ncbi:hypothetical protein BJ165DRAFT_233304 [Panaeolus papilionaceus]|nr:hypothetical protein BJ165DRAFT_233304 [Panaeolus papilionaceus]
MPPIRSPSFLHGSTPLPLSRPSASNGSVHTPYTRSLLGYPDLGGEPSQVAPPGLVDPTLYSEVPNSLNEQLDINLGHGHTHAAHHTAEPYPAVFGPGSRVMFQGGYPSFPQHTHFHRGYGIDGIQLLYQKASPAAAFNSKDRYDPPKCHPNTRVGLLTMTRNWSNKGRPRIMWLYGSAGAGKSAIAQTISEELRAASNLAASFFFSRTASADSHQGHEGRFVTTIAYQLSQTMPALRSYIEHAILNDSSVFDVTLREQVFKLIIKPLEALRNDQRNQNATCALPRIIVVDGLDECKEERGQQQVLDAIAFLVSHGDVFPFSVFVASRPEVVIRSWFTAYLTANPDLAQNVSLLDECDGDHDIEVFVRSEGAKIRQIHPFRSHIPADWPSGRVMKEIVKRASGQFIYAVTIMKYVRYLRDDPSRRLDDILQNTIPENHRPYAELDALYLHILRRTEHPLLVHRLFCFRIVSMSFFGYLNGDRVGEYLQKFLSLTCPVDILLVDLQSIMNCDIDGMKFGADLDMTAQRERVTSLGIRIPSIFHHASVVEFLLNPHRSEEFHIDTRQADKNLTEIAIKQTLTQIHQMNATLYIAS